MAVRKYSSNLSFVDLLFNLLVGFTCLFFLSFLLINPIAEEGKIDPVTEIMITSRWPDDSGWDIDLWVRGPNGRHVSYSRKDGGYMVLDRDDLGFSNDRYIINGVAKIVRRNLETITINDVVPGEYVVNVHYFGGRLDLDNDNYETPRPGVPRNPRMFEEVTVNVEILDMHPFAIVLSNDVILNHRDEVTVATFTVNEDGNVEDIRTDIQIRIRRPRNAP